MTKNKTELLPCPFCGGVAHIEMSKMRTCQLHGEPIQDFIVKCKSQKATYSNETNAKLTNCLVCPRVSKQSREAAIKAWNTRHQPEPTIFPTSGKRSEITDAMVEAGARELISWAWYGCQPDGEHFAFVDEHSNEIVKVCLTAALKVREG